MPALMPQHQLNDSLAAASKEADKLKHQGPLTQGDTTADKALGQNGSLGGGTSQPQVLSQGGLG